MAMRPVMQSIVPSLDRGRRTAVQPRRNGKASVWDALKKRVVQATTKLAILAPVATPWTHDLASFCHVLGREIELNEAMHLPADEEIDRLRDLAPGALEDLDAVLTQLPLEEHRSLGETILAKAVYAIRTELALVNAGNEAEARDSQVWTIAISDSGWTIEAA